MAVVNIQEKWKPRTARSATDLRGAMRAFTVLCDSATDGPVIARRAAGIPRVGESHPDDGWLRCSDVQASAVSPFLFAVTAQYEKRYPGPSDEENPLDAPAIWHWGHVASQEPIDYDINGVPLVNPVGERYDPPITRSIKDPRLTITRNEITYDPMLGVTYQDVLNSDVFIGAAAGLAKLDHITAVMVFQDDWEYWRLTYVIDFRRDGWKRRTLCQGYRYWTGKTITVGGHVVRQVEKAKKDGKAVSQPILLKADGKKLPQGGVELEGGIMVWKGVIGQNPVWLYYDIFKSLPFANLHLT